MDAPIKRWFYSKVLGILNNQYSNVEGLSSTEMELVA